MPVSAAHVRSGDGPAHVRSGDGPVCSHLDELDDEQREAVLAARGPVCVLAGAGTGKTRTITRRIAHLVTAGHVAAGPGAGRDVHPARSGRDA